MTIVQSRSGRFKKAEKCEKGQREKEGAEIQQTCLGYTASAHQEFMAFWCVPYLTPNVVGYMVVHTK
jgi:hypothetical protein